ncbi:MAG: dihydroxyacetone kinase subunit DhaL [Verrucomicrobiae bacterium]|nr:dihydroxyacetone kinase subunit DhaL [Verrucomicrobiae bacterium]
METINLAQLGAMLQAAAAQIRAHHEMLSRLDSAIGDGDHGTTILRTMETVERTVAEGAPTFQELLSKVAWAVMGCDGGSTSPLLGSLFLGMSEAVAGRTELDHAAMVAMFEAGINKLARQSRAKVGDKTMMDAFLPALEALKAADPTGGIPAALAQAAAAAAQGADATKNMRAKFGRARNLGDRVLGHPDPGAVSVSLIFKGFSDGLKP